MDPEATLDPLVSSALLESSVEASTEDGSWFGRESSEISNELAIEGGRVEEGRLEDGDRWWMEREERGRVSRGGRARDGESRGGPASFREGVEGGVDFILEDELILSDVVV